MMSIKSVKIPGVGMRNVKTALAAAFCAFIYYFFGRSPAFACIGAIFGMGSDMEDSRKNGGNRLFGTLIGGLLGMVFFRLYLFIEPTRKIHALAGSADVHRNGHFDRALPDVLGRRRAARRRCAVHSAVQYAGSYLHQLCAQPYFGYDYRRACRVGGQLHFPARMDGNVERAHQGASRRKIKRRRRIPVGYLYVCC